MFGMLLGAAPAKKKRASKTAQKTKKPKTSSGGSNSNTGNVGWRSAISSTMSRPMSLQSPLTPSKIIASANAVKTPMDHTKKRQYTRTQKAAITIVVTMTIAMAIWLIIKKGTMSTDALTRAFDKATEKLSGYLPSNIRDCVSGFMSAIKDWFTKTLPTQTAIPPVQTGGMVSTSFGLVFKMSMKLGAVLAAALMAGKAISVSREMDTAVAEQISDKPFPIRRSEMWAMKMSPIIRRGGTCQDAGVKHPI